MRDSGWGVWTVRLSYFLRPGKEERTDDHFATWMPCSGANIVSFLAVIRMGSNRKRRPRALFNCEYQMNGG